MTIEELAERIPEVKAYRSLWLGGKETGLSIWNAKFCRADEALLACAQEIERLEAAVIDCQ
jgi:hypothetical protein